MELPYKLLYWAALVIPFTILIFAGGAIAELSVTLLIAIFASPVLIAGLIAIVTKHAYLGEAPRLSRRGAIHLQGKQAVKFGWVFIAIYAAILTCITTVSILT